MVKRYCKKADCSNEHHAKDLCLKHYDEVRWNSEAHKSNYKLYRLTLKGRFKELKKNAKDRGIILDLTLEQYKVILGDEICVYCDNKVGSGAALDRLDNKKGYTKNNVVVCCNDCNKLRQDRLTPEETKKVVKYLKRLRKSKDLWHY